MAATLLHNDKDGHFSEIYLLHLVLRAATRVLHHPPAATAVVNRRRQKHYGGQESTMAVQKSKVGSLKDGGERLKTLLFLYRFYRQ
jgi:hypothetical protein